jgi:hypothetical protein
MFNTSRLIGLYLSCLLLLPGCMSRLSHASPDVPDTPAAEAVLRNFIEHTVARDGKGLSALVSSPFWVDKWIPDAQTVVDEFLEEDLEDELPGVAGLAIRIYPLADLAAIRPKAWLALQKSSTPAQLEGLYLGVMGLKVEGEAHAESGLVLLRYLNGAWSLAGLY